MLRQPLTHGDVGQLVAATVRMDGIQRRSIKVDTAQDERSTDVSLIAVGEKERVNSGWNKWADATRDLLLSSTSPYR